MADEPIKVGDTVRQRPGADGRDSRFVYEVVGRYGRWLWLIREGLEQPINGYDAKYVKYEPPPPFFEKGMAYRRFLQWSIAAQEKNVWEYFEVKQVLTEDGGTRRALGSHWGVSEGVTGRSRLFQRWDLLGAWDYENGDWKPAPRLP
jgi:hypothetical protein